MPSNRPAAPPPPRTIWTFPGQLAEYVGMSRPAWLAGSGLLARHLAAASEIVGEDLARICRDGPEADLRRDENAAVAVLALSVSAAQELLAAGRAPDGLLGYSLGLYSAAVVSGAISPQDGMRLARTIAWEGTRRFADQDMAMGFITGIKIATLEAELADLLGAGRIAVTNVNSQAQVVVAGRAADVDAALDRLRERAIRGERLPIGRPYHSAWMRPVAKALMTMCREITVREPRIPLYDHRDGERLETAEQVRRRLTEQLVTRLDWNASVRRLFEDGASRFVEMPPGSTTTRMTRWIERDAVCLALDRDEDRARYFEDAAAPGAAS